MPSSPSRPPASPPSPRKSTNVRPSAPWPLRAGFSALSALSTDLAARAGERLFMTPPRVAAPAREREVLAAWERFTVPTRRGALATWRRGAGPTVLLVHGWGGRGGQLAPFAPALLAAGCRVVTFDGPAHGASPGRRASVVHFADALQDLVSATGARAAIGHSMGGAALAVALARGLPLAAAAVIGSPRTPAGFFSIFGDALALPGPVRERMRARIEAWAGVRMDDLDVTALAPRGEATPLLVVHDRGDAEVGFASGEAIAGAWPGARLLATEGLGHRRILRDGGVIEAAVGFVTGRLPRCGCGRLASASRAASPDGVPRCAGCAVAEDLWDRGRRRARVG